MGLEVIGPFCAKSLRLTNRAPSRDKMFRLGVNAQDDTCYLFVMMICTNVVLVAVSSLIVMIRSRSERV